MEYTQNNPAYTQKEIREAHERVKADLENAESTNKGIALAIECQTMVLKYLTSIMEPENKSEKESEESPESPESTEDSAAE